MSFKNILVPFDFDPSSELAVEYARTIGKRVTDVQIMIFHVIKDITTPGTITSFDQPVYSYRTGEILSPSAYVKEMYYELKSKAITKLEVAKKEFDKEGISCQIIIEQGDPKQKILQYIQGLKIDLILMGTSRRKGVSKIYALGSVARFISENVTCPVILIH